MNEQKRKIRGEEKEIEGIVYRIIAEESEYARETAYDAIRRLLQNNKERICRLNTDGGQKICQEYKRLQ